MSIVKMVDGDPAASVHSAWDPVGIANTSRFSEPPAAQVIVWQGEDAIDPNSVHLEVRNKDGYTTVRLTEQGVTELVMGLCMALAEARYARSIR